MNIRIFTTAKILAEKIVDEIDQLLSIKEDAVISLAAGHTSLELFEQMAKAQESQRIDFSRCIFVGLDEWVGLDLSDDGSCIGFMYKNLFKPLDIKSKNIVFYDGRGDLKAECERIDNYISSVNGVDFMLLGLGINGHLGLNEPGVSFDNYSHVVKLSSDTKIVAQKYFDDKREIKYGITMGMKNFEQCKRIVLAATGERKKKIVGSMLLSKISEDIPATYLHGMEQASLFVDFDIEENINTKFTL